MRWYMHVNELVCVCVHVCGCWCERAFIGGIYECVCVCVCVYIPCMYMCATCQLMIIHMCLYVRLIACNLFLDFMHT